MLTGCISSSTSVTVNALPIAEVVDAGLDVIIPAGGNTTLTATGLGTFSWDTGETTSSIIVAPSVTTTYCVTLTDVNGCVDTDCATVSIAIACGEIFVPTIFSPNDDLNNDNLIVYGVVGCTETYNFSVYDRWGEMVFETTDPLINWDGTYKAKAMNTGVYFYKLTAIKIDGTVVQLSGNTTLVR
jgi:gliding motility-associated-like protein